MNGFFWDAKVIALTSVVQESIVIFLYQTKCTRIHLLKCFWRRIFYSGILNSFYDSMKFLSKSLYQPQGFLYECAYLTWVMWLHHLVYELGNAGKEEPSTDQGAFNVVENCSLYSKERAGSNHLVYSKSSIAVKICIWLSQRYMSEYRVYSSAFWIRKSGNPFLGFRIQYNDMGNVPEGSSQRLVSRSWKIWSITMS